MRPKPRVGVLRRGLALGLVALSTLVVAAQSPSLVLSETSLECARGGFRQLYGEARHAAHRGRGGVLRLLRGEEG